MEPKYHVTWLQSPYLSPLICFPLIVALNPSVLTTDFSTCVIQHYFVMDNATISVPLHSILAQLKRKEKNRSGSRPREILEKFLQVLTSGFQDIFNTSHCIVGYVPSSPDMWLRERTRKVVPGLFMARPVCNTYINSTNIPLEGLSDADHLDAKGQ